MSRLKLYVPFIFPLNLGYYFLSVWLPAIAVQWNTYIIVMPCGQAVLPHTVVVRT